MAAGDAVWWEERGGFVKAKTEDILEESADLLHKLGHPRWCLALHGNHDEHQCHLKPGHNSIHVCYCGVWW